jgi:hypothetical protein
MTTVAISHQEKMAEFINILTTKGHRKTEKEKARWGILEIARTVDVLTEPIRRARNEELARQGKVDGSPTKKWLAGFCVKFLVSRRKNVAWERERGVKWLHELACYADELEMEER